MSESNSKGRKFGRTNENYKTHLVLGGSIRYNVSYSFENDRGELIEVPPKVSLSGFEGLNAAKWFVPIAVIDGIIFLYENDPFFKKVYQQIHEQNERGR